MVVNNGPVARADVDELRKRLLEIDAPTYELDELVKTARERLRNRFSAPRVQPDGQDQAALRQARRAYDEARRREAEARQEATEARHDQSDATAALDTARHARNDAVEAHMAVTRTVGGDSEEAVLKAIGSQGIEAILDLLRQIDSAVGRVRDAIGRALPLVENANLDDAAATLRRGLDDSTRVAGVARAALEAATEFERDDERERWQQQVAAFLRQVQSAVGGSDDVSAAVDTTLEVLGPAVEAHRRRAGRLAAAEEDAHQRVLEALDAVHALRGGQRPDEGPFDSTAAELNAFIGRKGLRASLFNLTSLIRRSGLNELQRLLLSTEGVYETMLLRLLKDQQSPATDTQGLRIAIVAEVDGDARDFFLDQILEEYVRENRLDLNDDQRRRLRTELGDPDRTLPLKDGRTSKAIDALLQDDRRSGDLPTFVDRFAARGEISRTRFSPSVKSAMVDYLENLGLENLNEVRFAGGRYDEYFAQAYHFALFGDGRARATAIRTVRPSESDFDMNTFEAAEDQGVVKEHILAAAALYEMRVLGDHLGIFDLPTALVLRRARGRLDLSRGTGSYVLQEYKKYLRTAPLAAEDRQLLYKRVFGEGDGDVLADATSNDEFGPLWDSLMRQVAEYIRKTEENSSNLEDKVSRGPVDEAVRNLQYNLSSYATDIADDVKDMKEQFDLALTVLQNQDIISSIVAGPRQNMWTVIERVLSEDQHTSINVAAFRRIGVEGYKILRYVANFEGPTSDDDFRDFVSSAETWIIAQGAIGDALKSDEPGDEDDFVDDADVMGDDEDDWES